MAESKQEIASWWGWKRRVKKLAWNATLSPITSWQANRRGKSGNWQIFFSWAPKSLWIVTAAMKLKDACSLEGRQYIKKQRYHFASKGRIVKAMIFPVVMYRYESWTIKKAECQRIDVFKLWCWRRLLSVPWTARRSNQSILQEIKLEYSLEGLMLKLQYLATWCEGLTHWKRSWCWERLRAGGEGCDRGWDSLMASPT